MLGASALQTSSVGKSFALEIYAGCCRWSGAVAAAGLNILVPIDRSNGEWADTDNPWLRGCLLMLIELGLIWYVHLATECKLWSKARSTGKAPVAALARNGEIQPVLQNL